MYKVSFVHVMQSQRHLDKDLPNKILNKMLAILFLDESTQVGMLTILEDHIDLIVFNKRVKVANDKLAI